MKKPGFARRWVLDGLTRGFQDRPPVQKASADMGRHDVHVGRRVVCKSALLLDGVSVGGATLLCGVTVLDKGYTSLLLTGGGGSAASRAPGAPRSTRHAEGAGILMFI